MNEDYDLETLVPSPKWPMNSDNTVPLREYEPADAKKSRFEQSIRRAIERVVRRQLSQLNVWADDETIFISGQADSYHCRQLAEHCARAMVVDKLDKRFVSKIVVH